MKTSPIISKQFPVYSQKPKKYGLYELNRIVMERPVERYKELVAQKNKMIASGIKAFNLTIKPIK